MLVVAFIACFPFQRSYSHQAEVDAWNRRHGIFQCINASENVVRRAGYCESEGWKKMSDTSRSGEHNPFIACMNFAIDIQRERCEKAAEKKEPKP